ncbi:tetratricopeptide repeat protein [Arthrobacter sp. SAFR-044]|uniref:tetratricopeptide repeat protein n=1 Tax=Arthrobacter sp. SAFR-044 TaxID=3387278 RepID=UPI003F7C4312
MENEWFRSPAWGEADRALFEARLARSRGYNRAQYLRIKGLALSDAGEIAGARDLWLRVLADDGEFSKMEGFTALEHLGDSYVEDKPLLAETYYRRLLADNPTLKSTTATQHIKLAELLIRRGEAQDLEEAAELLTQWPDVARLPFPSAHFRWNLAVIDLAEATGDRETAVEAARRALDLAYRGPVFPRHKTVGVVHAEHRDLERLKRVAK